MLYTLYIKDKDNYFFIVDRKKDMIIGNRSQVQSSTFRVKDKEGDWRPEALVKNAHFPK